MSVDDDYDYWIQDPAPRVAASPVLEIQTIESVEPLDNQFGVDVPKTVPDALYDALFGLPEPTEAELARADDDPVSVLPLHIYAILDAAKVTNFVEMLAMSGLEHSCLFKGDAYDELKNVAPWIVRLEEGNTFTRNLFTRSDAPWHLWDKEPGIYLRSRGTLDEMWRHFRKFAKVQDERGKWYYLRLYDPKTMSYYLDGIKASQDRVNQVFIPSMGSKILSIIAPSVRDGGVTVFSYEGDVIRQNSQSYSGEVFELDARYTEDFLEASVILLRKYAPELSSRDHQELMWLARQNVLGFYQFNLISKPVIANALAIVALCGHPLDSLPDTDKNLLTDKSQSQFRRTSILLQQIKHRVLIQHG